MSQKNQYIKKSNNTSKNRSYVKGGQGTVFSQLKDMFKANSSANKQIEQMTTLQTTLKENLKTIDKDIKTFKDNYDKLVSKVSYVDSKIKDITDVNDQCKKLHPSVVTSTENKDTENKGFFGSLFGSKDESKETKDESEEPKDESEEPKDESDDKKDESDDKEDDSDYFEYDKDPFSDVLNKIEELTTTQ
jgi:chromosome segregation ATPase